MNQDVYPDPGVKKELDLGFRIRNIADKICSLSLGSTIHWVLSGTACNDKGEVLQKIPVRKF